MKTLKSIKLLFILLLNFSLSFSQNVTTDTKIQFTTAANLPYPLAYANCITDGKYLYAVAGYKGFIGGPSQILRYNPGTNRWQLFANMIGNQIQTAAAYVPSTDKIYVFGGVAGEFQNATITTSIQSINMTTHELKKLNIENPMPGAKSYAVVWDNKIYLFGGTRAERQTINSLYCFDPETLTFTKLANMPESLETAGAVVDGIIYTFGGYDTFTKRQSSSINAYNIKTNTWKKIGELPEFISEASVSASGNNIFVVGAHDDEDFIGYYDPAKNKFTKIKSNMQSRKSAGVGTLYDRLVLFGGTTRFEQSKLATLQTTQVADLRSFTR